MKLTRRDLWIDQVEQAMIRIEHAAIPWIVPAIAAGFVAIVLIWGR